MAQRITFRERVNGVSVSDGGTPMPAVSICQPRVKFIKGWLTGGTDPEDGSVECGNFTEYPLEATWDNIAELFFRVKDGKITACQIDAGTDSIKLVSGTPPSPNVTYTEFGEDNGIYCEHGVFHAGNALSYTDEESAYLDAYFGTPYTPLVETVYDSGSDERVLWPPETLFVSIGLSHTIESGGVDPLESIPPSYAVYGESSGPEYRAAYLNFTLVPLVAWTGADTPFDPDATLWVKASVEIFSHDTDITLTAYGGSSADGEFEIELAGGTILSIVISSVGYLSATVTTNPRIKATAWWPYKTTAGADAWNTTTGAAANGGPGA